MLVALTLQVIPSCFAPAKVQQKTEATKNRPLIGCKNLLTNRHLSVKKH